MQTWCSKFKGDLQQILTTMSNATKQAEDENLVDAVANEIKIVDCRKSAVEKVIGSGDFDTDEKAMKQYIEGFSIRSKPAQGSARDRLGQAPPCRSYVDLVPFGYFNTLLDAIYGLDTKDAIDAEIATGRTHREAVTELKTMSKGAVTRLNQCLATAKTAREQTQKAKLEAAKKGLKPKRGTPNIAMFEVGPRIAVEVPSFKAEDLKPGMNLMEPVIIKVDAAEHVPLASGSATRTALEAFTTKFEKQKSDARQDALKKASTSTAAVAAGNAARANVRAQKPLPSTAASEIDTYLAGLLPNGLKIVDMQGCSKELCGAIAPTSFGIAANFEKPSAEKDFLACMRLTWKGIRSIIMAPLPEVISYLASKSQVDLADINMAKVYSSFISLSAEALTELAGQAKLWTATCGPQDLLLIPAGVLVAERVLDADVYGIRKGFIFEEDTARMQAILKIMEDGKCKCPLLKEAVGVKSTSGTPGDGSGVAAAAAKAGAVAPALAAPEPAAAEGDAAQPKASDGQTNATDVPGGAEPCNGAGDAGTSSGSGGGGIGDGKPSIKKKA